MIFKITLPPRILENGYRNLLFLNIDHSILTNVQIYSQVLKLNILIGPILRFSYRAGSAEV